VYQTKQLVGKHLKLYPPAAVRVTIRVPPSGSRACEDVHPRNPIRNVQDDVPLVVDDVYFDAGPMPWEDDDSDTGLGVCDAAATDIDAGLDSRQANPPHRLEEAALVLPCGLVGATPPAPLEPVEDLAYHPDEVFTAVDLPEIPDPVLERDNLDRPSVKIPALGEKSYIRMAYLQAVMGNVFDSLSWDRATKQLNGTLDVLAMAQSLPTNPRPVRTLISARCRLGLDPDQWIIQYALCSICWKHHTPKQLLGLA
jgi:hypothetical protein